MKKGMHYIFLAALFAVLAVTIVIIIDFTDRGSVKFTDYGLPEGPTVTEDDPYIGSTAPRARLVLFTNFTCSNCKRFTENTLAVLEDYDVTVIWKPLPNDTIHRESTNSAIAALCAADQGDFWAYHNRLFEASRDEFSEEFYLSLAEELEFNTRSFTRCYREQKPMTTIQQSTEDALRIGVSAPPTLYIDDNKFATGALSQAELRAYLDTLLSLEL